MAKPFITKINLCNILWNVTFTNSKIQSWIKSFASHMPFLLLAICKCNTTSSSLYITFLILSNRLHYIQFKCKPDCPHPPKIISNKFLMKYSTWTTQRIPSLTLCLQYRPMIIRSSVLANFIYPLGSGKTWFLYN